MIEITLFVNIGNVMMFLMLMVPSMMVSMILILLLPHARRAHS